MSPDPAPLPTPPPQDAALPPLSRQAALGLVATVTALYGANWPVMKWTSAHLQPLWMASWRLGLGALLVAGFVAARGRLRLPHPADWPLVLSLGVLQLGLFSVGVMLAVPHLPAGRTALLVYTMPLFSLPLARLWLREPLGPRQVLGLVLGLAAIAILIGPGIAGGQAPAMAYLLLLGSAALWALTLVQTRAHRFRSDALTLGPWYLAIGALTAATAALVAGAPFDTPETGGEVLAMAYMAVLCTAFAMVALVAAGRALPAQTLSQTMLLTPVIGLSLSVSLQGEPVTLDLIAGLLLLLAAVILAVRSGMRQT